MTGSVHRWKSTNTSTGALVERMRPASSKDVLDLQKRWRTQSFNWFG